MDRFPETPYFGQLRLFSIGFTKKWILFQNPRDFDSLADFLDKFPLGYQSSLYKSFGAEPLDKSGGGRGLPRQFYQTIRFGRETWKKCLWLWSPKNVYSSPSYARQVIEDGNSSGNPNLFQTWTDMTQIDAPSSMIHRWITKFRIKTGTWNAIDDGIRG